MKFLSFFLLVAGFGIIVFDFLLMADSHRPEFFWATFLATQDFGEIGVLLALAAWIAPFVTGILGVLSPEPKQ